MTHFYRYRPPMSNCCGDEMYVPVSRVPYYTEAQHPIHSRRRPHRTSIMSQGLYTPAQQFYRATRRSSSIYGDEQIPEQFQSRRRQREPSLHRRRRSSQRQPRPYNDIGAIRPIVDLDEESSPEQFEDLPFNVSNVESQPIGDYQIMDFKAAASKLYMVTGKAEQFFDLFIRSFKQEMSPTYLDRASNWRRKVRQYNRDLTLPVIRNDQGNQDSDRDNNQDNNLDNNRQSQDGNNSKSDQASFDELQYQIIHYVNSLLNSKFEDFSNKRQVPQNRNADHDFEFEDHEDIDQQVQQDVAEALTRSISIMKSDLQYVKDMAYDHQAALKTLSFIKRVRLLCEKYRSGWINAGEDGNKN